MQNRELGFRIISMLEVRSVGLASSSLSACHQDCLAKRVFFLCPVLACQEVRQLSRYSCCFDSNPGTAQLDNRGELMVLAVPCAF